MEERRRRDSALRRLGVAAFRRRDLTDAEPALERRRIAHPRLGTTPIFKVGLQQGFAAGGMGLSTEFALQKS